VSSTQIGANEDLALENVLRQIESEPPEGVRARERNTFDEIAGPFGERLVLFGAGPLGKGVLAGLRQAGVEPLSFADNNQELWGKDVSGLLVLSPDDAVRAYGETACFVVTIYQGSRVRRQLASLGCRRVSPFVPLLWKYADIFIPQSGIELPHRLVKQCEAVRACPCWRTTSRDANSANNWFGATGWTTPRFRRRSTRKTRISQWTYYLQVMTMCSWTAGLLTATPSAALTIIGTALSDMPLRSSQIPKTARRCLQA